MSHRLEQSNVFSQLVPSSSSLSCHPKSLFIAPSLHLNPFQLSMGQRRFFFLKKYTYIYSVLSPLGHPALIPYAYDWAAACLRFTLCLLSLGGDEARQRGQTGNRRRDASRHCRGSPAKCSHPKEPSKQTD